MCGLAGIFGASPQYDLEAAARRMAHSIRHRGPDGEGFWFDQAHGLALIHRRLAILDPSSDGAQPMLSVSQRYVLIFNGEIYNFGRIRDELAAQGLAPVWRGGSDTEILLAAIDAWGIQRTLQSLIGMFALVVWDRLNCTLILARDRAGEKPLYYGTTKNGFVFASELKAICSSVDERPPLDRAALAEYMRLGYVPGARSIYHGISKLLPGHYVEITGNGQSSPSKAYWRLHCGISDAPLSELASARDQDVIDSLHDRLYASVGSQMVSDVPLGAFLSGGIDSSTIVAMMQHQSTSRVKTFTMGFSDPSFDEAPFATSIARHLGTEHVNLYVGPADALKVIPSLSSVYDEPFADPSQIPSIMLSHLARQNVTVALCGDGGDELFYGYQRYNLAASLEGKIRKIPSFLRNQISQALLAPSQQRWDGFLDVFPQELLSKVSGRRLHLLGHLIKSKDFGEIYSRLMSRLQPEESLVLGAPPSFAGYAQLAQGLAPSEQMRIWDFLSYLPDDLLVKIDRASMSASLEVRAPFLDHRVVEMAFAIPHHLLERNGVNKWILRRILDRYLPANLVVRPKSGFGVPLAEWLRGPLRDWAFDLLDSRKLKSQGYLDEAKVQRMLLAHQSGRFDRSFALWNVLMFQLWLNAETGPAYHLDRRAE